MKHRVQRYFKANFRAVDENDKHRMEGYACVFGQRSVLMADWQHGPVYEVVEPGAITEDIIRSSDIVACIEHNPDRMIARSVNGEGTLSLAPDDNGLKVSWDVIDTTESRDCYENVKAGNYRGMSFGFWVDPNTDVSYTKDTETINGKEVEVKVRHINTVQGLFDVSVVAHPAYPTTSVESRSLEDVNKDNLIKELRAAFPEYNEPQSKPQPPVETRSEEMKRDYDLLEQFKSSLLTLGDDFLGI